jgi:hypothetical protein
MRNPSEPSSAPKPESATIYDDGEPETTFAKFKTKIVGYFEIMSLIVI